MIYVGIILICIVGTLLHFVYEFSGHNKYVAIFAAVNESTWEHIKIGMTPTILWSFYDGFIYGTNPNYIVAKSLCLLTIIVVIPILFYSYTVFTKKSILFVDVICFFVTIICSQLVFTYFIHLDALPFFCTYLSSILLFIELGCYFFFTFQPFKNFMYQDPITNKYGLEGHPCHHDHHHDHNHEHK